MDAFAKMDIFFLVSTVAIVIVAVFIAVLLYYIIRTAKDVSDTVHIVKEESARFAKGASSVRLGILRKGGGVVQKFIAFVQSLASSNMKSGGKKN